jgi:hypothetical protein
MAQAATHLTTFFRLYLENDTEGARLRLRLRCLVVERLR